MKTTKKQVALITGSSRGIGAACALALAHAGYDIVINYHTRQQEAVQVSQMVQKIGRDVLSIEADIADPGAINNMVQTIVKQWGRIDVLVNNAGISAVKPFDKITVEEWDQVIKINLRGTFLCSQKVIPIMKAQRSGSLIMISSQAGQTGGFFVGAHYSVSKAGIICLTKYLAKDLAPFGIRVNCICPGIIDTEMSKSFPNKLVQELIDHVPLKGLGKADDVAQAVVFLASDTSNYITGATIPVNGGLYMP